MKKQIVKIAMGTVVAMAFVASLTLSVGKNENGGWSLKPITAFGQTGSEESQCDVCVSDMMLAYKGCWKKWAIYNSQGKKTSAGMVSGDKLKCVNQSKAKCDQSKITPCDADIPAGAIVTETGDN